MSKDKKIGNVSYNIEAAKNMSKEDWVKAHEHHSATVEHYDEVVGNEPAKKEPAKGK